MTPPHGDLATNPAEEDALLLRAVRKAGRRLVPFLLLLYVVAFLDRVNLGYVKQSFLRDTGLGEAAFAMGAGIFFLGYAFLEIPSNLAMYRLGARAWMGRIMVTWGVIAALMMFARTAPVLYTLRFALGVMEGGFSRASSCSSRAGFPQATAER